MESSWIKLAHSFRGKGRIKKRESASHDIYDRSPVIMLHFLQCWLALSNLFVHACSLTNSDRLAAQPLEYNTRLPAVFIFFQHLIGV